MSLTSYRAAPPRVGDECVSVIGCFGRPGGDRLSRVLRRSIIGAGGFHGRVRDGIGWIIPRHGHQVVQGTVLPFWGAVWWTCGVGASAFCLRFVCVCVESVVDDFYACGFGV